MRHAEIEQHTQIDWEEIKLTQTNWICDLPTEIDREMDKEINAE